MQGEFGGDSYVPTQVQSPANYILMEQPQPFEAFSDDGMLIYPEPVHIYERALQDLDVYESVEKPAARLTLLMGPKKPPHTNIMNANEQKSQSQLDNLPSSTPLSTHHAVNRDRKDNERKDQNSSQQTTRMKCHGLGTAKPQSISPERDGSGNDRRTRKSGSSTSKNPAAADHPFRLERTLQYYDKASTRMKRETYYQTDLRENKKTIPTTSQSKGDGKFLRDAKLLNNDLNSFRSDPNEMQVQNQMQTDDPNLKLFESTVESVNKLATDDTKRMKIINTNIGQTIIENETGEKSMDGEQSSKSLKDPLKTDQRSLVDERPYQAANKNINNKMRLSSSKKLVSYQSEQS